MSQVRLPWGIRVTSNRINSSSLSPYSQTCKKFTDRGMFGSLEPMTTALKQLRPGLGLLDGDLDRKVHLFQACFLFHFCWSGVQKFCTPMPYHCQALGNSILLPLTRKTQQKMIAPTKFWLHRIFGFPFQLWFSFDISAEKYWVFSLYHWQLLMPWIFV